MKRIFASALALSLMLPWAAWAQASTQPAAGQDEQVQLGKKLYQHWCISCHGVGPGHPGTQALEARYGGAVPAALEQRPNLSTQFIEVFVRNGISVMPFFRKTEINDDELAAIGAYLSQAPSQTSAARP